jgi:diguanylate cyclase (GGDEF)-like protein
MIEAGEPFSLLMMDLDSFKAFNDTYGHPAGDTLLQTVAKAIVSATRQNDRAYRYGGDEFALLLFGAARAHAEEVAARVRAAVREGVRNSFVGTLGVQVSASIGAAHWPADGREHGVLVEAADADLYRAKRQRSEAVPAAPSAGLLASDAAGPSSWVDAARDLIAATTTEAAAAAIVCAVTTLCDGSDAFVALTDDIEQLARPALSAAVSGGAEGRQPGGKQGMVQVAASGAFLGKSQSIRHGGGLWGRVWQGGTLVVEDDGEAMRLGAPLLVSGTVVGILGVVEPSQAKRLNHSKEVALVADLGSAALQRLLGSDV